MDINSYKYAGITQWENSFRNRRSKCTVLLCRGWGIFACAEHEGMWNVLLEYCAINREFSSDRLMSVLNLHSSLLRPVLFSTEMIISLKTLTVTDLEDVPDGHTVRGGITAKSVRNKVPNYFLTDAGATSWQMSKIWTIKYIK